MLSKKKAIAKRLRERPQKPTRLVKSLNLALIMFTVDLVLTVWDQIHGTNLREVFWKVLPSVIT
jgi:hypothetical protein